MHLLESRYVYWKVVNRDVKHLTIACKSCAEIVKNPSKAPLYPWDDTRKYWDCIHSNYGGHS